jgi:hypothetical protein
MATSMPLTGRTFDFPAVAVLLVVLPALTLGRQAAGARASCGKRPPPPTHAAAMDPVSQKRWGHLAADEHMAALSRGTVLPSAPKVASQVSIE